MNVQLRITSRLVAHVRSDLARPHSFASERVGFLMCKVARALPRGVIILPYDYKAVEDQDYLNDPSVGAMIGPAAIRKALQLAYKNPIAMFHVHLHAHLGRPWFSEIDLRETNNFVPDFWHVRAGFPHGALVFSHDSLCGLCWMPKSKKPIRISAMSVVGSPMTLIR